MLSTFFANLVSEASEPLKSALVLGREYATRELLEGVRVVVDVELGEGREIIGPPIATGRPVKAVGNPNKREHVKYTRYVPCWALFMATSTKPGATADDHRDVIDGLVDKFLCAGEVAAKLGAPALPWTPGPGGYLVPEGEPSEDPVRGFVATGYRYLLRFTVPRGAVDRQADVGAITDTENTVSIETWSS
jgi:hypothetical protein